MATPGSGTITLNQVHVEAGGSSGSQCSFNDSDIRSICASSSGSQFSMSNMYARAADMNFSGSTGGFKVTTSSGYIAIVDYRRGFIASTSPIDSGGTRGSMSPTSDSDYFSGNTCTNHWIASIGSGASKTFTVYFNGEQANSDTAAFKSMVIGSTTFNRSDATYVSSGISYFTWTFGPTNDGFQDITSTQAPYPAPNTTYYGSFRRRV